MRIGIAQTRLNGSYEKVKYRQGYYVDKWRLLLARLVQIIKQFKESKEELGQAYLIEFDYLYSNLLLNESSKYYKTFLAPCIGIKGDYKWF